MEEKKCLKCGRPRAEDQAFCDTCLADMAKHPVKPGVVVLLPPKEQPKPAPRRRYTPPSPEEQVAKLKQQVIALWLVLILALSAAVALGWLAVSEYLEQDSGKLLPGQNYSAETLPENPETE